MTAATLPEVHVPVLKKRPTAAEAIQAAFTASVARIFTHVQRIQEGDPEAVHQARVGVRRLRSDLRTFRAFLTLEAQALRDDLHPLGARLGWIRDLDVFRFRLVDMQDVVTIDESAVVEATVRVLDRRRAISRNEMLSYVESDEFRPLAERLYRFVQEPPIRSAADRAARKVLLPLVRKQWRGLKRRVEPQLEVPGAASDMALHRLRIRTKRVRYAAEVVAPVIGTPAFRFAGAAAKLQTVLGEHQDAVIARGRLLAIAANLEHPVAEVFVELAGVELARRAQARRRWPKAWRRLERQSAWL